LGRLTEKVSRNVGVLRREIRRLRQPDFVSGVVEEAGLFSPAITRPDLVKLVTDEEMAHVEYLRLAEDPDIRGNELAHSTVLGIADDEKRHAQQLKDILELLRREGKIL